MLDLSPQLLQGLHAYFLHGVSLTDSGKIADLSRQAMRYKINYRLRRKTPSFRAGI